MTELARNGLQDESYWRQDVYCNGAIWIERTTTGTPLIRRFAKLGLALSAGMPNVWV
jgi:hypothetical protein